MPNCWQAKRPPKAARSEWVGESANAAAQSGTFEQSGTSSDNALAGRESLGGSTSKICAYRRKLNTEGFTLYGSILPEYARHNRDWALA